MKRNRPQVAVRITSAILAFGACAPAATQQPITPAARGEWVIPPLPPPQPITAAEYAQRRAGLAAAMSDGVLIAFGSPRPQRDYLPYAQDPNFRYLTGVLEPDAALVLVKQAGRVEELLFVAPRDPAVELWEGERLGLDGARALTGIAVRAADRLAAVLDSLLAEHRTLHLLFHLPRDPAPLETLTREQQILARLVARHPGTVVEDLSQAPLGLRASKSAAELDLIRRAVYVSVLAHREAMRTAAPALNEFEIQALVEYTFRRHGADGPAYASIVASGPNATTLHYRAADRYMREGELLLMDVGASYRGYAADVTRTVPLSGRFSPEQRAVYEIVLDAQKTAERVTRAGASWQRLSNAASTVIAAGLTRLGLIDAPGALYDCRVSSGLGECSQVRLYYMHGLGHGVGLEVHDPDPLQFGALAVGSAFTIEPGIYIRADVFDHLPDTPGNAAMVERLRPAVERYRDIGVRIEDVYIISTGGAERVSAGVPREIDEVEALMAEAPLSAEGRKPEVVEWYRLTEPRVSP